MFEDADDGPLTVELRQQPLTHDEGFLPLVFHRQLVKPRGGLAQILHVLFEGCLQQGFFALEVSVKRSPARLETGGSLDISDRGFAKTLLGEQSHPLLQKTLFGGLTKADPICNHAITIISRLQELGMMPYFQLAIRTASHERRSPRPSPKLLVASLLVASPGWATWALQGRRSIASPLCTSAVLAINVAATRFVPTVKLEVIRFLQRYLINPAVRVLLAIDILPLGIALLETTGRCSGKPRRNPVGEGRIGETFWIVAEHGRSANYVRNLEANPSVRVKIRRGLRTHWRSGVAQVLDDDDPYIRQRQLCRWHPLRAINAATVRLMGTDLITIRIDLA